ncbi:serine/threonine-protein phosphatase 4 regulatory subunit 4-like isoform X1 [Mizuhopecten yessoensis]|uniref:serine/threonine-protein phosphatase 4 regulatory subunit 4-like isoform X1 n=1 Tax=Mizuhopecten yessoensis TaxID=6573 RepID=UPI000B45E930|nr:serine/threonine-protein phosphatase 4 regulatory subunit 4-like isoform X1 [Mizuhopecten yessoensis]
MDKTTTSLADDLQDLQLDRPTEGLKSTEELEKLTVDEQLSDIERAVYLLSSGQEVQRISVIHNLPDLLRDTESHDECMRRVVPKVREVLYVAQTEMQLAASSAFLQILQKNLVPIQNYTQTFLQTILNSVDARDPDVASAWLETLLDVIDLLPKDIIKKEILNIAIAKGQLSQTVYSRLSCCKILGKIATKFEPFVIKKEILPVVQSLCQDVDYEVRGCMCRQLDCVARGLGLEPTKSAILPELVELTNDEEGFVRTAGLETVVSILSLLDEDTCNNTIIPLVCKFCQQAMQNEDSTLPVVAKQLGRLAHGLQVHLTDEQKQWFVDYYRKLCKVGLSPERGKNTKEVESDQSKVTDMPQNEEDDQCLECRKNAAFNFPAMFVFVGPKHFKVDLLGIFSSLCKDPNSQVRKTVASGFHEVTKLLGSQVHILQHDLINLLKDDSVDVLRGILTNIVDILDSFLGSSSSNHTLSEAKMNSLGEVIPAILASDEVVSSFNNWRLQEELMTSLASLTQCCSNEVLYTKVIPVLFNKLKTARALPVRHTCARSSLIIIRTLKKLEQREELVYRLVTEFCHGRSCHQRSLFIDICKFVIELYSKTFFKKYFYEVVLELHKDPVPNIRLRLCSLLPPLKRLIKLPTDRNLLQQLDLCVRKLLVAEKDRDVQNAIKVAVEELDKIHVQMESLSRRMLFEQDLVDQKKEDEEKLLIELEERDQKREEEAAEKKKGEKRNSVTSALAKKGDNGSKIPGPRKGSKNLAVSGTTSPNTSTKDVQNRIGKNSIAKSKSTNSLSQIPRRGKTIAENIGKPDSPKPIRSKIPAAKVKPQPNYDSGKKDSTVSKSMPNKALPRLSRLPLYSSQPNLHSSQSSGGKSPIGRGSGSKIGSGTKGAVARSGALQAPGSAGTSSRGSMTGLAPTSNNSGRRGSFGNVSSSEAVKTTKGSNGAVPSTKEKINRKKSK